mmetsp:Transcript_42571/g.81404  ORF Transcript_42571/g.81404 Transcript_42571/m.81404 type:complete len:122 (-) Transcript_42571:139-504(-)
MTIIGFGGAMALSTTRFVSSTRSVTVVVLIGRSIGEKTLVTHQESSIYQPTTKKTTTNEHPFCSSGFHPLCSMLTNHLSRSLQERRKRKRAMSLLGVVAIPSPSHQAQRTQKPLESIGLLR